MDYPIQNEDSVVHEAFVVDVEHHFDDEVNEGGDDDYVEGEEGEAKKLDVMENKDTLNTLFDLASINFDSMMDEASWERLMKAADEDVRRSKTGVTQPKSDTRVRKCQLKHR